MSASNAASNQDFLFAQEAQALGYVSEAQVVEAFKLQRIMAEDLKIEERLANILVKRGWLADEQSRRVLARIEPEGRKNEIEGYRLLERVGRGAMGTVYKALHLGLQRVVAIKVLHQDLAADATQVERLKAEAKLLASLDHPNILRALDAGESNGFPFIVTEYVEGQTLRERLASQGPLPEAEALEIVRALADALEKARRMGVVHRDVKPGNVLLTRGGQPKLMDLGLAKGPVDLGLTQHGATVGTPQYISPEQAQDPRRADIRSDIYSLGATLYALLTGRPPFEGSTLAEILTKVLYESPTPPRAVNPKVSAEAGYLVERMMLKDPGLRYQTPAEVAADVDRILAGRSIMPAGFHGNWEAWLLRRRIRRWTSIGAVALAAALVLGLGAHAWLRARARTDELASAEALIGVVLPETTYGPADTLLSIQDKRERAEDALDKIGHLDLPGVQALTLRMQHLGAVQRSFEDWRALVGGPGAPSTQRETITELLKAEHFRRALELLDAFAPRVSPPGGDNPVAAQIGLERERVRLASRTAWLALEEGVRQSRPADLDAWLEVYRGWSARAGSGFVLDGEAQQGVPLALSLRSAAETVVTEVLKFESRYAARNVLELLRTRQAVRMTERIEAARRELEEVVGRIWSGPAVQWTSSASLQVLVAARLRRTLEQVEETVAGFVRQHMEQAAAWKAEGRLAEAVRDLDEVELDLFNAGYRRQSDEVRALRLRLEAERDSAEALSVRTWEALLAAWCADLATLDAATPAALRLRLEVSATDRAALGARGAGLEELAGAPAAVERLYELAMAGLERLQSKRQKLQPRLRTGATVERGWVLRDVDAQARTFGVAAGGAGREPVQRSLFDLVPAQIVELARGGSADAQDDFALALGHVALLPSREVALGPDVDLAQSVADFAQARRALDAAGLAGGALAANVVRLEGALLERLRADEQSAFEYHEQAKIFFGQRNFGLARYYLLRLLTEAKYKATTYLRQQEPAARELLAQIESVLEKDNMARWLRGVQASRQDDGTWALLYDFDTVEQLDVSNWALGRGVLEPFDGPAVTPRPGVNLRLHLRKGMEEPEDDVPLTWRSIFDPAEPIEVAFDLYPLDRPYLLAVDVDGLAVAVLCLDPAWFPEFRAPPQIPLLPGEKRAPAVLAFGRGRGVAFHDGADFGDVAAWRESARSPSWPEAGRGERLVAEERPVPVAGELFGFSPSSLKPGQPVQRVRVRRDRARLTLFVDEREVASAERPEWARRGTQSERVPGMTGGSGAIRILTWTPVAIDNLKLRGTVRAAWLAQQQRSEAR